MLGGMGGWRSFAVFGGECHDDETDEGEERVREEGSLNCLPVLNIT